MKRIITAVAALAAGIIPTAAIHAIPTVHLAAAPAARVAIVPAPAVADTPSPNPSTPAPRAALPIEPPAGEIIEVSIRDQRLTLWRDGRVAMRLAISTGMPGYDTPTGHYRITAKYHEGFSKKWGVVMPWAMQWNGNYMIHQLTHYPGSTQLIGRSQLGRPASHGCVRVDAGDAERLYHATAIGTPVWVH